LNEIDNNVSMLLTIYLSGHGEFKVACIMFACSEYIEFISLKWEIHVSLKNIEKKEMKYEKKSLWEI
jgi:hypothetical protein